MILGVNGIRLVEGISGVARCIEAVLNCLEDLEHPFDDIRVYSPAPIHSSIKLPSSARNVVLPSPLPSALWEQLVLARAHPNSSVLLCPSYVVPLLSGAPTLLIHHGSYEGFPSAFSWWSLNKARAIYALSAHRASVVSTVSNNSKRDMVKYYGMRPSSIHVIPEGVDTARFKPLDDDERVELWRTKVLGPGQPFILYVGKPTERRNLSALVSAFALLRREKRLPHKLLIVGADLPGTSRFQQIIEEEKLAEHVVVLGHVGHDELPLIYNAADVLVYPSSYEGFGMPILEAMSCGTPVIALNNSAIPELAGGIALLLDRGDAQSLASGIGGLLEDSSARKAMRLAGPARAALFDWRIVTRRYLDLMIPLATSSAPVNIG